MCAWRQSHGHKHTLPPLENEVGDKLTWKPGASGADNKLRAKELRNKKKQDEMNAKKAGEGGDEEKAVPWENKVKEVEEEFWAAIQASDAKE